jgi:hypothetical protein
MTPVIQSIIANQAQKVDRIPIKDALKPVNPVCMLTLSMPNNIQYSKPAPFLVISYAKKLQYLEQLIYKPYSVETRSSGQSHQQKNIKSSGLPSQSGISKFVSKQASLWYENCLNVP